MFRCSDTQHPTYLGDEVRSAAQDTRSLDIDSFETGAALYPFIPSASHVKNRQADVVTTQALPHRFLRAASPNMGRPRK